MTTNLEIITDAYRQSNLLAITATPTAAQQTEALRYLNRIVLSVYGNEAGDNLQPYGLGRKNINAPSGFPWYGDTPSGDWYVPENQRLMCNLSAPTTVPLHPQPDDGARFGVVDVAQNFNTTPLTISGNGRRIENGLTLVLNTAGADVTYMYRGDTGSWVLVSPLVSFSGTFPFPVEFDDFFISMLALRLNPAYGATMDQQSISVFQRSKTQFQARYQSHTQVRSEYALTRLSNTYDNRYNRYDYLGDSTNLFNRGNTW